MKKFIALCLTFSLVLVPCLNSLAENNVVKEANQDTETLVFSIEEMKEDYNYLWDILNENYPWWGVIERSGVNKKALYNKYLNKIDDVKSGYEFFLLINDMAEEMNYSGHFRMISSNMYFDMLDTFTDPYLKVWLNILDNPLSKKNYEILRKDFDKNRVNVSQNNTKEFENISTRIISENKTAYVKIRQFYGNMKKDGNKLIDFYKEVSDYDNLIIDITGNGGGSDGYWMWYIVAPNIDEPLTNEKMFLFSIGDYNKRFFNQSFDDDDVKPISKLPKNTGIKQEDIKYANYFSDSIKNTIYPTENKKLFNGKIWLLVDGNVYSSTESFSIFCKGTGFATLVGRNTGGDGGGMTPAIVSLPNTGLIARYTFIEFINSDGTNSEEYGTTPDIISDRYETPLETCLKEINKLN